MSQGELVLPNALSRDILMQDDTLLTPVIPDDALLWAVPDDEEDQGEPTDLPQILPASNALLAQLRLDGDSTKASCSSN